MNPIVLFGVFGAIWVGVYLFQQAAQRKRLEGYQAFATMHGLVFDPECTATRAKVAGLFDAFTTWQRQKWRYGLSGTRGGAQFTAFEYCYLVGGGRGSHWHEVGAILWELPQGSLPQFAVAPESWWDKITERLGWPDFDFPEDKAFSDDYLLRGADEAGVRGLFDASKRTFCVSHPGTYAAAAGNRLLWWRDESLPDPALLESFLTEGDAFRQLFFK